MGQANNNFFNVHLHSCKKCETGSMNGYTFRWMDTKTVSRTTYSNKKPLQINSLPLFLCIQMR